MTDQEAIKILTVMAKEQVYLLAPNGDDAVKRALEALKFRILVYKEYAK